MRKIMHLALFAGTLLFAACKKEQTSLNPSPAPSSTHTAQGTTPPVTPLVTENPANPLNPYDYVGATHNALLDQTRPTWASASPTSSEMMAALEAASQLSFGNDANKAALIDQGYSLIADEPNQYNNVINGFLVSQHAKDYIQAIKAIGYGINTSTTYNNYKSSIVSIESAVMSDGTLSAGERKLILKSASIARFSAKYWVNEFYIDDVINDNGPVVTQMGFFRKVARAIATIYADYSAQGTADRMQMPEDLATVYVTYISWLEYESWQ